MPEPTPTERLRDVVKSVAHDLRQQEAHGATGEYPDAAVKTLAAAARRLEDALDPAKVSVPGTGGMTGTSGPVKSEDATVCYG